MKTNIIMLAYAATPEIVEMTRETVAKALVSTGDDEVVTLGINGGPSFAVTAHERLRVVYWPERKGLGKAYNDLAFACHERYLCFLHNDCYVPTAQWIGRLAEVAEAFGFGFPVTIDDDAEAKLRGVVPTAKEACPSCCYVVRRDVFGLLGGFDPAYEGCHFEDWDLFLRGVKLGATMARTDEVTVFHRRGVTRSATADESNAAFKRNVEVYKARWMDKDGRVLAPGVRTVTASEILGGIGNARPSFGTDQTSGLDATAPE